MAWGVFYRPAQYSDREYTQGEMSDVQSLSFIREYNPAIVPPPQSSSYPTPHFRTPLPDSLLDDPAFSSDPRSHPHFPLTDAGSYKAPSSKSSHVYTHHLPISLSHEAPFQAEGACITRLPPCMSHPSPTEEHHPSPPSASVSLESESLMTHSTFTSPTVSSATSHSLPPIQIHGGRTPSPVTPVSPSNPAPPPYTPLPPKNEPIPSMLQVPDRPSIPRNMSAPEIRPKVQRPSVPMRAGSEPILSEKKKRAASKGPMTNLVRRLTPRRDLDSIDELDETDPFGGAYHHGGPYEAIGSNLAELGPPHMYNDVDVLRGDIRHSKREVGIANSSSRMPPPAAENGLTLPPQFGQIPQRHPIHALPAYNAAMSMTPSPNLSRRKPGGSGIRPDHSRSQSLPNPLAHYREGSSALPDAPNSLQNHSSPSGPRVHCFGEDIPCIPNRSLSHIGRDSAPYAPHQRRPATDLPPNGQESASHSSLPPSPRVTPSPPPNLLSQQSRPKDGMTDFPPLGPRQSSVRSLDSSRILNTIANPSSGTQNRSLDPPRMHHLPKRLVMPAPLQPQPFPMQPQPPAQAEYGFPPTSYDGYPEHLRLEELKDAHFEGLPAMYDRGRRRLRRKSSSFPAKAPIPTHVPLSQNEAVPPAGNFPSNAVKEVERMKEGPPRRKLIKRKN
ncbi:hypothetical protein BU15DRAFT_41714 [Melanogaster broomeanus]|nr:hypothetical protein BU15DRAFT_41714 [Melanogaster broomeanus]